MHMLIINGPNLNLLGTREPEVYGSTTLADLTELCSDWAGALGHSTESFQSNHEGELIDRLHGAKGGVDAIVFNPGAFTHTSYALQDAISSIDIPTVEVHISNVMEREPWRAESRIAAACVHTIYGRGIDGYKHAISHLHHLAIRPPTSVAYGPEAHQIADLRLPEGSGPHPIAILVHGGFWRHQWTRDTIEPLAVDLTNRGIASLNIEYSRSGLGECSASADVSLALAAIEQLARDHPIDTDRSVLIGHSAGGHLVLEAAAGSSVTQVVSLAGVSNLVRAAQEGLGRDAAVPFLGGTDPAHHCPTQLLPLGVPILLVHGTADQSVPVDYSEQFEISASESGDAVTFLRFEGADHSQVADPKHGSWLKVVKILEEFLF